MIIAFAVLLASLPASAAETARSASPAAAPAEIALYKRCADPERAFDPADILADASAREDLSAVTFDEAGDLAQYGACRSLAGAADGCTALAGLGGPLKGADVRCRKFAAKALIAQVALRGGDAEAVCRTAMAEGDDRRAAGNDRACAAIVAAIRAGDVDGACGDLEKQGFIPKGESCRKNLIFWSWKDKPRACSDLKDTYSRRECADSTGLIAGLREAAQCAKTPACLALETRSTAACGAVARAFAKSVCARAAKAGYDPKKAEILQERKVREAEEKAKIEEGVRKKAADKIAAQRSKNRPQFQKGQSMSDTSKGTRETMERLEKGLPIKPATGDKDDDSQ